MSQPSYEFREVVRNLLFEFESVSEEKTVCKIIVYQLIDEENQVFNLALLDKMDDGSLDDTSESNNKDLEKVLSTVVKTIPVFFEKFPSATIFFKGSTAIRTRLYQIVIANYGEQVGGNYEIYGTIDNESELFVKNKKYESFLLKYKH
jgi:hypothetical protein